MMVQYKKRHLTLEEVLKRLSFEEMEKFPPLDIEAVDRALRLGREERLRAEEVMGNAAIGPPGLRFT